MKLSELYKALADESRLRLVNVLAHGVFTVGELTSILSLSQPTVSHHLKVLSKVGLVSARKDGTWSFYSLNRLSPESPKDLVGELVKQLEQNPPERSELDLAAVQDTLRDRQSRSLNYFEKVAPHWNIEREQQFDEPVPVARILSHLPQNCVVAELGCGSGSLLADIAANSDQLIGIDYSIAMLDQARERIAGLSSNGASESNIDLRLGSLEHLPLADSSIDCAVACMVFHHIAHPPLALRDTWRALRPGGKLIVVDFCKHNDESMRERFADLWLGFDTTEFKTWVEQSGFKIVSLEISEGANKTFLLVAVKGGSSLS